MPTTVSIRGAFVLIERHRSVGPHQAPTCSGCGAPWPCQQRIEAGRIVRSVLADAFGSAGRP
jgi:hypothetical protein